jgi:beta propeller repeat protein
MYYPGIGEVSICTAPGLQDQPAIDGDIIVWRDRRNGNYDIYMKDIKTGTVSPVSTRKSNQSWPDVSGNYIVYADDRNGNWDIFMYDIYKRKETLVCTESHNQTYPVVTGKYLENLAIAYADDRNNKKDIYIYYPNLFLGQDYEYLVPLDISPSNTPQTFPHLDDTQLVFQDPLGGPGTDSNIWAFRFTMEGFAGGSKKEICVDYPAAANQTRPRTSQGNIVWQDERNGNSDIYIWERPPFSDLQISVKEISDPIKVGDTLEYIVTVRNDGPKMNTSVLTYCTLPVVAKFDTLIADRGAADYFGNTVKWDIDTLRNGCSANLKIFMVTYDLAILEFKAITAGNAFDSDGSNNEITATTKVKNFMPTFVGEGSEPSIQTEPDGRDHLIYFGTDSSLVYATMIRKGKWEYKSLGKYFGTEENDMVLDNAGNLQVVISQYFDSGDEDMAKGRLVQVTLNKEGKLIKRIIALSDSGFYSLSLKTDSKNELHLVYQNAPCRGACKGVIKEMRTNGGQWLQPEVISRTYADVDMAIDKENNLHASYYLYDGPLYQKKNSAGNGTWERPVEVEPGWNGYISEGMSVNIATDDALNPHIAYYGSAITNPDAYLTHAWKANDVWHYEPIEGKYSSPGPLVIDPDGKTNLSYLYTPEGESGRHLWYATNIPGPFIKQEVSEIKGRGFKVLFDMGRDMDKFTHIAYNGGFDSVLYALIPAVEYFKVNPEKLDFGPVAPGSEMTLVMELTNPMSENIRIDSMVIGDKRISFDRYSFILYRYSSESVNVTFKQTDAPWNNTRLTIWYNSPSGLHTSIPVKARDWQPELTSDQDPIEFGAVTLGTLVTKTVKLTNSGVTDLIISAISISSSTDFKLVGPNSATLQPEQTYDVQISFKPSTNSNQYSYLNITTNDPVTPNKKIEITGKTANPQIFCQSNTVDFGFCPAGQSLSKTVTIKNTGELVLNITSATLSGMDMSQFSLSNSCTSIAPGESCTMKITMTPTMLADLRTALVIISNSPSSGTLSIILYGSSQVRTLDLSTTLIDFGSVSIGEKSQVLLELRNTGSVDVHVNEIKVEGNNVYEFSQNYYGPFITAGSTAIITVSFIPQFEGDKTADLVISTNDSYKPVQTVILTGKSSLKPLQVNISADPQSGSEPLDVKFTASVTGGQPPYHYLWNFDNMKTSEGYSPEYVFTGPAVYYVSLKVTDFWENSIIATIKVSVTAEGVPVVIATVQPDNGSIPLSVQFNAKVTGGDAPLTYLWDFRDGSTSTLQNPVHIFTAAGNYLVRLAVTDADNDKCRDSVLVKAMLNNSIAGQIWDETGLSQVIKANLILYPQANINDSTSITINGSNSYLFPGLPVANYTLQAIPDAIAYPGELPTYLGNKLALFEATWVNVTGNITGKDIKLVKKPSPPPGTGSIEGNIVSGSKKGLTVTEKTGESKGNPVQNAFVFLKGSADGKLKAYDISNTDGSFSFEGLENGSYYFLADVQGKPMDATNTPLVISDVRKDIEILATVGTDKITVKDLVTGINDATVKGLKVYPVPANDYVVVEIPENLFMGTSVNIRVLDLSGKYVLSDKPYELSGNPVTLNIADIPDGIYIMQITDHKIIYSLNIIKMR